MAQLNVNTRMDKNLKQEFDCTVPNAETLKAIEEVKQMEKDPKLGKSYTDIDKMIRELLTSCIP